VLCNHNAGRIVQKMFQALADYSILELLARPLVDTNEK
jgi:hypothetical protein